jgi:hypothetical protein
MKDLAPYVCLFDDCKNPQECFQTFSDWTAHIQNEHVPLHWDCVAPIHDTESFDDADLYMEHMRRFHHGTFADSQLPVLAQMSARAESRLFTICPLCNHLPKDLAQKTSNLEVRENQTALQKHIAQHLQSLALVSLGWLDDSKSNASSKRDNDLVMEDDTESLKFDDPPDEQPIPSSDLDPDWKGTALITKDIGVDQAWDSSRTSEDAALEWWFTIDPSADLDPDHMQDETLAPFVAAFLKSTATEPTSQSEMANPLFPAHPEDFINLYRVKCDRLGQATVYTNLIPWQKYDDDNSYHLRGDHIYTGLKSWKFVVYHDYSCPCMPNEVYQVYLDIPIPKRTIELQSYELLRNFSSILGSADLSIYMEIPSPYLVVYRNRSSIESRFKLLDATARRELEGFLSYVYSSVGLQYEEADRHFAAGLTNSKSAQFLFSPGGIIVTTSQSSPDDVRAFWHDFTMQSTPDWSVNIQEIMPYQDDFEYLLSYNKVDVQIVERSIDVEPPRDEELVRIQDLKAYPLRFAAVELVETLQARGNKWKDFWASDGYRYVSYAQPNQPGSNSLVSL